jgi:hypothetical protein
LTALVATGAVLVRRTLSVGRARLEVVDGVRHVLDELVELVE